MAKTFTAPFAQTPKKVTAASSASAAAINTDTATNTVLLLTAGADGCLVTRLSAMPRATVTATAFHLLHSSDNGTTQRLVDSITIPAQTVSTTAGITATTFSNYTETTPMRLSAGDRLYIGMGTAQTAGIVVATAEYMDF